MRWPSPAASTMARIALKRGRSRRWLPRKDHVPRSAPGVEDRDVGIADVVLRTVAERGRGGVDRRRRALDLQEGADRRLVHHDLHLPPGIGLAVLLIAEHGAEAQALQDGLEDVGVGHPDLQLRTAPDALTVHPPALQGEEPGLPGA